MTLGTILQAARQRLGLTLQAAGDKIGLSKPTLWELEHDRPKRRLDPERVIKIADTYNELRIATYYCESCPVRNFLIPRVFPDLNHIQEDSAIMAIALRREMEEALPALDELAGIYSRKDFAEDPGFLDRFYILFVQLADVKQALELFEHKQVINGIYSSQRFAEVYKRQHQKCIARGHHLPEETRA